MVERTSFKKAEEETLHRPGTLSGRTLRTSLIFWMKLVFLKTCAEGIILLLIPTRTLFRGPACGWSTCGLGLLFTNGVLGGVERGELVPGLTDDLLRLGADHRPQTVYPDQPRLARRRHPGVGAHVGAETHLEGRSNRRRGQRRRTNVQSGSRAPESVMDKCEIVAAVRCTQRRPRGSSLRSFDLMSEDAFHRRGVSPHAEYRGRIYATWVHRTWFPVHSSLPLFRSSPANIPPT